MEELKKKTEAMLRAVLISSPRGVPLRRLDREYKSITFSSIPLKEMGFATLDAYIKSIPKVASLTRDVDGEMVVKGVASESDQHVAKLIAKQRKPKKRSKPAPKLRRPTFVSRPHVGRPVPVNRPVVVARPVVAVTTPLVSVNRYGPGVRFIPPRMMRQAVNQATAQSIGRTIQQGLTRQAQQNVSTNVQPVIRTVVEQGISRQVQQKAQEMASATNRKVTVVTRQGEPPAKKTSKKKPKSPGSGPNWQDMEVTLMSDNKNGESERVVYLSNSSAPKAMNPVDQSNSLSKEGHQAPRPSTYASPVDTTRGH